MKQFLTALTVTVFLLACNNEKKGDEASGKSEEKKGSAPLSYAYTPEYSSDFSMSDSNHAKMVLDLFKMWEDNKLDEMKPLLADSVWIDFPDGNKFADNTADSMLNFAREYRKKLASVRSKLDGWMSVRSNDKKEDYVLTWGNDYTTDISGKQDSIRIHAYFLIKNNKIRGWSEFQQKLAPPPSKK
jgi:hypothetical protein